MKHIYIFIHTERGILEGFKLNAIGTVYIRVLEKVV